jgi:flagellar basal body-associated protein FliL
MNDKVMTSIMFVAAISLSCIAAFYSIAGLTAIFAAAVVPIIIMGGILEVSKLVVASWLYRNWNDVPTTFRVYFTTAIIILMMLTSMGIFGFLSKAHLDQAVPAGDVTAQVQIFDDKIKTERDNIEAARKAITQMDAQVDQKLSRSTDEKGADKAVQIRRSQSAERKKLQNEIAEAQKAIVKLQEQRAPIATQARKIEAEVGPIKYIAALIYGDTLDQNMLEKAVRWVIIMIVLVFDPLAVLMLVAVNWSLKKTSPKVEEPEDLEPWINYPINPDPIKKPALHKILRTRKPKKRKWLEKEPDPTPLPEAADWPEDRIDAISQNGNDGIHYDPNEYVSPAKTIEEEVDELNKPLNSLDRLKQKYGEPNI